ncbi:ribosomal protein L7/L12 [Streptomyces sp. CBMA123]|uniref:ribosomal protein L7/L12 n=1 Tax=Streptomyces sp. CBMA123 TaxID=1896313 RepID=UPI00166201E7|nr:ribosomal protein L7/L12 [Streptomyces sp. CBMA123]
MAEQVRYVTLVCDDVPQNVVLHEAGPRLLEVAKILRAETGAGLWRAKQAVTGPPPVLLFECVEERAAHRQADRLRAAGATVTVEPWQRRRPGPTGAVQAVRTPERAAHAPNGHGSSRVADTGPPASSPTAARRPPAGA